MEEDSKCVTIFLSEELLQANVGSLVDDNEVSIPDMSFDILTSRPGKVQQPFHKSPGLCRSFASIDLLHDVHSPAYSDHSGYSLDSLEGALDVHSDRTSELPGRLKMKRSKEGKTMGVEEEEKWVDARECGVQAEEKILESVTEQEEEEDDDNGLPSRTGAQTNSTHSKKHKQVFHCLPKSLVPSEIAHCLFELEKECRGVERESKSVKWKMEVVHRSVQTVQETLRTLLTHLVEAQSFSKHSSRTPVTPTHPTNTTSTTTSPILTNTPAVTSPAQPAPAPHPHLPVHQFTPHSSCHPGVHPPSHPHPHTHCQAAHTVARRPSETCLTQAFHPHLEPCSPDLLTEPPSYAQRRRERTATFHILTELRESVEQLLSVQKQECDVHREVLALLRKIEPLQQQERSEGVGEHGVSGQLDHLHRQASQITQLPLLCQRCQAEVTQISHSEV